MNFLKKPNREPDLNWQDFIHFWFKEQIVLYPKSSSSSVTVNRPYKLLITEEGKLESHLDNNLYTKYIDDINQIYKQWVAEKIILADND